MDLASFRQRFTQYDEYSDDELTRRMHTAFYSEMDYDEFVSKINPAPTQVTEAPVTPEAEPPVDLPSVDDTPEPEETHTGIEKSIYGKPYQDATAGPAELEETVAGRPYQSALDTIGRELPEPMQPASPEELASLGFARNKMDSGYEPGWWSGTARASRGTAASVGAGMYKMAADSLDAVNYAYQAAVGADSEIVLEGRDWLDEQGSKATIDSIYNRMIAEHSTPENAWLKMASEGIRAIPDMAAVIGVTALTRNPNMGYAVMGAQVFTDTYATSRYKEQKEVGTAFYDAAFATAAELGGEKMFNVLGPIAEGLPGGKQLLLTMLAEGGSEAATEAMTIFEELTRQGQEFEGWLETGKRLGFATGTGIVAGGGMKLGGQLVQAVDNKLTMGKFEADFNAYLQTHAQEYVKSALDPNGPIAHQQKQTDNATVYTMIVNTEHDALMAKPEYQQFYAATDIPGMDEADKQKTAKENYADHVIGRKRYEDIFEEEGLEPLDLDQKPVGTIDADGTVTLDEVVAEPAPMEPLDLDQPLQAEPTIDEAAHEAAKPKDEGQLPVIRRGVPAEGQVEEGAVQVRVGGEPDAPRGLQQAAGGGVDVPAVSPGVSRKPITTKRKVPPDLLQEITTEAGGLNREAWEAMGVDPAEFKRQVGGLKWLFPKKGGLTPADLLEHLQKEGYIEADSKDRPTEVNDNDAVNILFEALGGKRIVGPRYELEEAEYQQRIQDEEQGVKARAEMYQAEDPEFETSTGPTLKITDYLDNMNPEDRAYMDWISAAIKVGAVDLADSVSARIDSREITVKEGVKALAGVIKPLLEKSYESD